jgi:hypothetical protein
VISSIHRRHRATEFKKFLTKIDAEVPAGLAVHIVCDNCATYKAPMIMNWLSAHLRCQVHFTQTGSSYSRRTNLTKHY